MLRSYIFLTVPTYLDAKLNSSPIEWLKTSYKFSNSRNSPRKAAITARAAAVAQELSDEDDDVREVVVKNSRASKKATESPAAKEAAKHFPKPGGETSRKVESFEDENSSDSIVELDEEDPLADPLSISKPEPEKPKPPNGEKIVTLDSVAAIQNLAKQQQAREEPKFTIIDPR